MRINLLFMLFLSLIGDVFSQRGPMMMFRGIPGPMTSGRVPFPPFGSRFGPFPSGFSGAPGMQPTFQGPMVPRGQPGPGFQMMQSRSMGGTSFPGNNQVNGMTNFMIPSPQFGGAASLFGATDGTLADVRRLHIPLQLRRRNQPDSGVVLDRAVAQQWQRQRLTQGNEAQDTSIRLTPTIPQFPPGNSISVSGQVTNRFTQDDGFPTIPAQNSGSNGASSSISSSQMLIGASGPSFSPRGSSGTIIIPQQQPSLSAQPSGLPPTAPSGFGPSSSRFGQRDPFLGIPDNTNDQFQLGMTGFQTQSQASIPGPTNGVAFTTRFQPLPQNVENFRQQLQTGRAGTGVETAFPMVPSDNPAFSIQFQNNEPVRAVPAESSQVVNRVVQGSDPSMNAPLAQTFMNRFQFTDPTSSQSQATFNVHPITGVPDLPNVNPMNNRIPSQQINSQVPSSSVFQSGLQPSVPSDGLGLTDLQRGSTLTSNPNSLTVEQFQAATNVATAPIATPRDASTETRDIPQAAPPHNFINILSSPSDFSFFVDQPPADSNTNTNLVNSQSIDPNQRVVFSMDSKGPAVRLQQVDPASQNTVEGVGVRQGTPSSINASTPKGGSNMHSFSFTVSGNSNRVKVKPPSPPRIGLIGPSQTGNKSDKPKAAVTGGPDNTSATPSAA